MRDFTLAGFIAHIPTLVAHVAHAEVEALHEAAEMVQREAKGSLGTYQPQSGPFEAWAELADSTKDDRVRQGYAENEPEHRTGAMGETIEKTFLSAHEAEVGSDSEILEYQELGTENMPPRSILGGAAARKADDIAELTGGQVYAALIGAQVFNRRLVIR